VPQATPAPTPTPLPAQPASRPVPQATPVAYNSPPPPRGNEMVNPTDGSVLLRIPGGAFTMGSNDSSDEKPPHRVTVGSFWMGKFEVTNARYRRLVKATGHKSTANWQGYASRWGEDAPVVYVSWNDAAAYCRWAGGRLPTEEEWEYAARGSEGREFPWGDTWDASRCCNPTNSGGKPRPVGSFPQGASPFGCLDMAGNVWEWTASWYDRYPGNTTSDNSFGQKNRVLRGGSWGIGMVDVNFRGADRYDYVPVSAYGYLGFRLARSAP